MFSSSSSNIPSRFLLRRSLFTVATSSSSTRRCSLNCHHHHHFRHHSDLAAGILEAPPAPPSSPSSKKMNSAPPPPPPPSPSSSIGATFSIPAPTSHKLNDLATTLCPLCNTQTHIKELLRHLNNDHPTEIQSGAIDREIVRKLIRERYTLLHAAIKQVWSNNSPKHAVADKSKGGYPCRHCVRDETGLHPLFPTVDSLMKHIAGAHEKDGIDVDEEEVPKRMSADDVNQIIEILKNGSNSGSININSSSADSSSVSSSIINNNNGVVGISVNDVTASIFQMSEGMNSSELPDAPSAGSAMSSNQNFIPFPASAAFRCELCNKQTDREIDMLQHYDSTHADIVYNLGLSKKFTVRNFIGNDGFGNSSGSNLEEMGESSLFASSGSGLSNKSDADSAAASTTCWVKAILAPSSGIPRVLIMPWTVNQNKNNNNRKPELVQQQQNLIREQEIAESPAESNSEQSEIANSLNEDENGVIAFSSSRLPPPPPRSSPSATKTNSSNATNIPTSANSPPTSDHLANLLRCQHCGAKLKSAQSFEMHLKDKHKIIMTDVRHQQKQQEHLQNNNNNDCCDNDDGEANVVKTSNSSVSFDDLVTRADLSNMKYYCTFGTCNRKQFLSRTAFQAHIEAKHGDVVPNFDVELEKILRNKYCSSSLSCQDSEKTESNSQNNNNNDNSVLSTSLTCNICSKTGFSSYNAFANHLQDKHDIVIEKYSSGINTKSSSNIFVVSSSIFDSSTAASETIFNQNNDNSDISHQQGSSLNQESVAYECEHCGKSFTTFNGYDNHVRSKHHVAPTRLILKRSSTNSQVISSSITNDSNFQNNFVSSAPPSFPSHIAAATTRNAAKLSHDANNNEGEEDAAWKTSSANSTTTNISENMENQVLGSPGIPNIPLPPPSASPAVNFSQLKNAWWCNHCNRGFGTPQALQGHLMSKHGYRPSSATTLACPVSGCRKVAADQFALVDHLKQAHRTTGEISDAELRKYDIGDGFACVECGKRFLVEPELNQHFALNHSGLQRPANNFRGDDSLNDDDYEDEGNGRRQQQGRRFNNYNNRRTGSANFRKRF